MPEAIADRMLDLERYFRENRASRITEDVRQVTGREPRRFAEYVQATARDGSLERGGCAGRELRRRNSEVPAAS